MCRWAQGLVEVEVSFCDGSSALSSTAMSIEAFKVMSSRKTIDDYSSCHIPNACYPVVRVVPMPIQPGINFVLSMLSMRQSRPRRSIIINILCVLDGRLLSLPRFFL